MRNGRFSSTNASGSAENRVSSRKIVKKFIGYAVDLLLTTRPVDRVNGNHRHTVAKVFFSLFLEGSV